MSKKLNDLQAGALNAWTSLQQAALYRRHAAEQIERDEAQKEADERKKQKEEEAKKKRGDKKEEPKPEAVTAAAIVEDLVKWWSPPVASFLNLFGPAYAVFPIMIFLHLLYWWTAPWYLQYLVTYPAIYFLPIIGSIQTLFDKSLRNDRIMWLSYWVILAGIEYVELCFFGDAVRSLLWWPKIKALACIVLYSIVDRGQRGTSKTLGSIHILGQFLPDLPDDPKPDSDKSKDGSKPKDDKPKDDKGRSSRPPK